MMVPLSGLMLPSRSLKKVLLPAPLGPIMQRSGAGLQGEVHAIDRANPAEGLGEALGPQQGAVARARPTARHVSRHADAPRASRCRSAWKRATSPVIAPSGSSIMTRIRIAPWTTSA